MGVEGVAGGNEDVVIGGDCCRGINAIKKQKGWDWGLRKGYGGGITERGILEICEDGGEVVV